MSISNIFCTFAAPNMSMLRLYIFRLVDYMRHRLTSIHTMGHHIHSPFLFHIASFILPEKATYYSFKAIEDCRWRLMRDKRKVYVEDYGTGQSGERKVADIASSSLKPSREAQLLMRLAVLIDAKNMVELGTSLGISTAYLASANSQATVTTFEGASEVAKLAQETWTRLGITNIRSVVGPIDETLLGDHTLFTNNAHTREKIDLAFLDANHTGEATLRYFEALLPLAAENSIYVLDDIHSTPDMLEAWHTICKHEGVTATFDLYSMGLVFFNSHFEKKTYRIRL